MPRFFKQNFADAPYIEGADAAHIARSLRMRVGEELVVCDGGQTDYYCTIAAVNKERVDLNIEKICPCESEPDIDLTLCPCLMKGDKMDSVIRHGVELGVGSILPLISENCVSRPDAAALTGKTERWQKIAAEAAGQSGRGKIPTVLPTETFSNFCEKTFGEFDLVLFFYEAGGAPLGQTLWDHDGAKKIAVITGPEGGFTKKEAEEMASCGAKTIHLGKRILRAETAPLAATAGIMLLTDNLE